MNKFIQWRLILGMTVWAVAASAHAQGMTAPVAPSTGSAQQAPAPKARAQAWQDGDTGSNSAGKTGREANNETTAEAQQLDRTLYAHH